MKDLEPVSDHDRESNTATATSEAAVAERARPNHLLTRLLLFAGVLVGALVLSREAPSTQSVHVRLSPVLIRQLSELSLQCVTEEGETSGATWRAPHASKAALVHHFNARNGPARCSVAATGRARSAQIERRISLRGQPVTLIVERDLKAALMATSE